MDNLHLIEWERQADVLQTPLIKTRACNQTNKTIFLTDYLCLPCSMQNYENLFFKIEQNK